MLLPTEDQETLGGLAREVLSEQAGSERLRALLDTPTGHDADLWKQLSELGWLALPLPEDLGGLDSELPDLAVVVEACGRALMPSALTGTTTLAWLLARHASSAQRAELLPRLGSGEAILAWSLTTADGGGEVRARPTESGLALTGVRKHVPDAAVATHVLVDATGPAGPAMAVVAAGGRGLTQREENTIDLTRRYRTLRFDEVAVPADMILRSDPAATELFQAGVVLQCAESVGAAARAFEMTCEYVRQRQQFGRPIGGFQAIKHRIADMYIELEGARAATRDAAEAVQGARSDAAYAVRVAKSWTGRAASAITSEAIQLHGGIGFTWEHDLHLLQRRAKANELLLGAPAWHDEGLTRTIAEDV